MPKALVAVIPSSGSIEWTVIPGAAAASRKERVNRIKRTTKSETCLKQLFCPVTTIIEFPVWVH
jgi:hypothetical protein